ncbi:tRNA dimethylallyltransferase 2 [Candidatus Moduliflexus flocculans]|uniref:tRNA dimethylallyltransferase n=1 Tax=Candidatus Moduliflexus flocculans TaxID=1499966 RepID=A0A0S6VTZ0_9BACT|nr:tRNA dimethylallyltransferase 2 [Candidatus Moduliflexus flocculans]
MKQPLIIIAGPTGVGKTGIALEVAERVNGEIVGADSMQIYRGMDIGTAKPTREERERVPHYLIDIRSPNEEFSVAEYVKTAAAAISEIAKRDKMPVLVGGTGMYIEKLLYGLFEGPGRDETFRQDILAFADAQGNLALHHRLQQVDPETAQRLHPNDRTRIIRALEVHHLTGSPISAFQQETLTPEQCQYLTTFFVINAERDELYARINARVEGMIAAGLVEEVQELYRQGFHQNLAPLKSLGYKEIGEFLAGKCDLPSAIELIQRNTRHYAKRQLTWFRKYADARWIQRDDAIETCFHLIHHTFSTGT